MKKTPGKTAEKTPRKTPRKTPGKKTRKTPAKTPIRRTTRRATKPKILKSNDQSLRCKNWLLEQKLVKDRPEPMEEDIESDDSEEYGIKLELDDENPVARARRNRSKNPIIELLFACEWQKCREALVTYDELIQHVDDHAKHFVKEIRPIFECQWDLCEFDTTNKQMFIGHCAFHSYHTYLKTIGEQTLLAKRPLPACTLDSRRRNVFAEIKADYLCMWRDCEFKANTIQMYFGHVHNHIKFEMQMQKKNNRNTMVACEWIDCTKKFNRQQKMKEHLRSHTGERIFACANCGSTFNSHTKFYDHYKRQAMENNYKCSHCPRYFATEEMLSNHMYHHINIVKCTICDMTCPSPSALTQHFRYRHCTDRPFQCPHCVYSCVTKWDLKGHISRIHESMKPNYECTEFGCDFTCLTINQMRQHERIAHGVEGKVYCCHICNNRYLNGHSVSLHLIKKHGFQLPSGHRRFTYCQDLDGVYRVQITRLESLEVSEQIATPSNVELGKSTNIQYELTELQADENGLAISLVAKVTEPTEQLIHDDDDDDDDDEGDDDESEDNAVKPSLPAIKNDSMDDEYIFQLPIIDAIDDEPSQEIKIFEEAAFRQFDDEQNISKMFEDDDSNTSTLKSIDDFSVMKKYLPKRRNQNQIMVTVEEVDSDGNIVKTETQQITEYSLC